jgi:prepilin-type N-terminal cleavage/methylation domain-containing protein
MASTKQRGFSLLELMIVVSISLILAVVAGLTFGPVIRQQHVDTAYNTTLMALRRAHDQAAADMRIYTVTFQGPTPGPPAVGGTITVTQDIIGALPIYTATLPPDVTFHAEPGIPTSPTVVPTTPDGFGAGAVPFDFDQALGGGSNTIYFYPDGTAQDNGPNGGNINNGVVYLGIPGQLPTCRAISMWGYTGRIRGWQLYKVGATWSWSQK